MDPLVKGGFRFEHKRQQPVQAITGDDDDKQLDVETEHRRPQRSGEVFEGNGVKRAVIFLWTVQRHQAISGDAR